MTEMPELKRLERRDDDMHLTWSEGTTQTISYVELRYWCPCAKCSPRRDHSDLAQILRVEIDGLPIEKPTVKPVGGYALHFEWSIGCSSGIHRFERLWALGKGEDPDGGRPYRHGAW